ncbi:sodium:solute symporter family transporter [Cardinium endosymbiont of Philonthus spinipes]|uniref:sodium:solute symporter family transporter n=1 Tax=Cardinium endosymbiont of Philonthus spinipes TaxID=3077941 RepID=UPI00313D2131
MALFIVAAFLSLTLVVGIYFSRKKTTFREYAVGNKQFATATLVATVLATDYGGGGLIRNVECIYELGLFWIIVILLNCFGNWFIGRLALRMGPFMQHLSIAETIGSVYGIYPRILTALVSICSCIVIITSQMIVMSKAIEICLVLTNPYVITALASLLLIFYSTFGGIRAVTFTDVLQFLTFSIIIPLLAWCMFAKADKPAATIIPMLQGHTKFQFSSLLHGYTILIALLLRVLSALTSRVSPHTMQRVYMASGPIQAQKVFSYATLFSLVITSFITLISLFVFVKAPDLPKEAILEYIMNHIPPFFKGFVTISLLAMAMSTADSCLNACSVMVGHDIVKSLQKGKEITDGYQLKIARRATLVVGLLAMLLAFKNQDLLKLLYWSLNCSIPIVTAPFILAAFGFRGTTRTALVGMATGGLAIVAWNKWVKPSTGMDGSFPAMVANGLAMMAAHHLFKQPKDTGWMDPDYQFKQLQQAHRRKRVERKEAIKNGWTNKKAILLKLMPSDRTIRLIGLYMVATAILDYWFIRPDHIYWAICQVLVGALFTSSKTFFSKTIPAWCMGVCWLIGLAVYLPVNLLEHWWNLVDPVFTTSLSLAHCAVILSLFPLYLGIGVVTGTLLLALYPISVGFTLPMLCTLLPLFVVSLLIVAIIIWFKVNQNIYINKILYLENHEKIRKSQQLKASLYDAAAGPTVGKAKGYGAILTEVIGKIEESISFLDSNIPLYKQDFQSIINKLYDWAAYFNRRAKAKKHALLQPTQITLDKLIRKVELALSQEVTDPPRLLVETITSANGGASPYMVCDIHQVVYLLVKAVLRVGKLQEAVRPVVRIQLHSTALQFKLADPVDGSQPVCILFQATALVISQATAAPETLPKVKQTYGDAIDAIDPQGKPETPPSIDLQQETLSSIVGAHYGYWETLGGKKHPSMLLVLPNDVTDILGRMTTTLPLDALTLEAPATPKEQADSMMVLMKFHDYVCKFSYQMDPVDVGTISGLLLLLRQHFGFKRHASGQLFYVRAVGIAELVVEWAFHSPKVIYAALLYELVRRTCLPLSYVKEHYNLGVYAFVLNVVGIDKRQSLDHPSLLYVQNRLKEAIKEEHIQLSVLFIKLAERLYDLRHAAGYIHPTEVQHMAQETLAIDVKLANTYLGPEIATVLEVAAKKALKVGNSIEKNNKRDTSS